MEKAPFRRQIFLVLFIALFVLVAKLFYPFMTIILWSGLIYGFLDPLYQKLTSGRKPQTSISAAQVAGKEGERRPWRIKHEKNERNFTILRSFWAGTLALLGVAVLVIPVSFLAISLARQIGEIAGNLLETIEKKPEILDLSPSTPIGGFIFRITEGSVDLSSFDLVTEAKHLLSASSGKIIGFSGALLKNVLGMGLTLAFMVFTLYFLFVDGRHLASMVVKALPIERTYARMFLSKLRDSGRQLVLGFFLVSLFQSGMMFFLCLVFGIPRPLVLASLTAVASFIPMAGTALVWFPLGLIIVMGSGVARGVLFMLCAAVFVSSLDNFIRPMLLGERLRIHPLLIFFSILGGLSLFGFNGLVLGPLILILFFSAAELYDSLEGNNPGDDMAEEDSVKGREKSS